MTLLTGSLLLMLVIYRARNLSFTCDESYSYLELAKAKSVKQLFQYTYSNHHVLNSILMRVAYRAIGNSELALRLPGVAAYGIYLLGCVGLCRLLFSRRHRLIVFLGLNFNMFLLDFFSLARGYALGVSLLTASLYFLIRSLESKKGELCYFLSLMAGALAVLSHLTFLNYYVALVAAATLIRCRTRMAVSDGSRRAPWTRCLFGGGYHALIVSAAVGYDTIPRALKLRRDGDLYYGLKNGFDTGLSLVNSLLYNHPLPQNLERPVGIALWIVLSGLLIFYLNKFLAKGSGARPWGAICVASILFFAMLSTVLQHYLFGILYLIGRTALLFVPLFVISFLWALSRLAESARAGLKIAGWSALCVVTGANIWLFGTAVNTHYTLSWPLDSCTRQMMDDLEVLAGRQKPQRPVHMAVNGFLEPVVGFYADVRQPHWLGKITPDAIAKGEYDYYYLFDGDLAAVGTRARVLKKYPFCHTNLLQGVIP